MVSVDVSHLHWGLMVVQSMGVLSALVARVNWIQSVQRLMQKLFFFCLILVAVATTVSLGFGFGDWTFSGATLAVMAVAATLEVD